MTNWNSSGPPDLTLATIVPWSLLSSIIVSLVVASGP